MKAIAIIPARGGSKRIPHKNSRLFCGKPIIAWSIEAAKKSEVFERIIVSTDDQQIADIAMQYGAQVPFMRPSELAKDETSTRDVVNHAINWLAEHQVIPDYLCCIYATAPFVTSESLQQGWQQLSNNNSNFCFTVTRYPYPIQRALLLDTSGKISMRQPEFRLTRSQDLPETFHDAGQFYWGKTQAFLDDEIMYSEQASALIIPSHQAKDIDTEEDWVFAEKLFRAGGYV